MNIHTISTQVLFRFFINGYVSIGELHEELTYRGWPEHKVNQAVAEQLNYRIKKEYEEVDVTEIDIPRYADNLVSLSDYRRK